MPTDWTDDSARQTPVTDGCLWCKGDVDGLEDI